MGRNRQDCTLKTTSFKNRSGTISFRVNGNFFGERIRKNFSTEAEANIFRIGLLTKKSQEESFHSAVTRLNGNELKDAEGARSFLNNVGLNSASLTKAVSVYADNFHPVKSINAREAVAEYIEACRLRGNRPTTLNVIMYMLFNFINCSEINLFSELTPDHIKKWIFDQNKSQRTQRDRRDRLLNFYKWAVKEKYAARNLISDVDRRKVELSLPSILNLKQSSNIIKTAAYDSYEQNKSNKMGVMLPYFSITLFSGVRPEECRRLTSWEYFDLDEHKHIEISERISKTNARLVPIHGNLLFILRKCKECGLNPGFFSKRVFNRVRKNAGVLNNWQLDILRHTFASHHYALYKNMNDLCYSMGNSPAVLRRNYLRPVPAKEAKKFFAIMS